MFIDEHQRGLNDQIEIYGYHRAYILRCFTQREIRLYTI